MLRFARKGGGYIGADVVEQKRRDGVATYLVYCAVEAADADVMGNEPVYAGDKVIGITTSGAYGHCVEQSLAFAYVDPGYDAPGSVFDIEILGERRRARVLAEAAWDPRNERLRA